MKFNSVEPQSVISMKLLRGTDGKEKMSKSLSNYISINDTASDIFGKVMSIPDELMAEYFDLCTDMTKEEIEAVKSQINKKENLKSLKMDLAAKIVEIYHGNLAASSAFSMFENVFSNGDFPEDAVVLDASIGEKLVDILVANNIVESKSEVRRLIEAGALSEYPDKKILDTAVVVEEGEKRFRLGKKTFFIVRSK
jgi:tyrosyl-tRNA synthetase